MNRLVHIALVLASAGALLSACQRPSDLPDGSLSRTKVDFQAPAAGGNPNAETLYVSNSGRGTLEAPTVTISYANGADWLIVTVTSAGDQFAIAVQPVTTGLAAGTFRATLKLSWASGSAEPALVSVTLVVPARTVVAPRMSLSRTSVELQAPGASGDPQVEKVWVANDGGGTLATPTVEISYQDGAGWLGAVVSVTGSPYTVSLQAATAGRPPGVYRATVTLACAGASASPGQVSVTLTIPDPRFQLSVDALAIEAPRGGGDPAQVLFQVVNAGRGAIPVPSIDVAYAGTATGWLTTAVAAASDGYAVTAQARVAGIPSGVHRATLTVRGAGAAVPPATVPVTLTVLPPEVLLSTREVAMRAPSGGLDASATLTVTNAGGGLLANPVATVTYEPGTPRWDGLLDVGVSGTPALYQLKLTAHQVKATVAGTGKLPHGIYTASVQVTAPGAAVAETVRVTLEVPAPAIRLSSSAVAFAEYPSCPLPAPATVTVTNVGGGELAAPVVAMDPGVDAWLGAAVTGNGQDAYAVVLGLRAFPPVATGGTLETTVTITDPTGVASALPLRVRFDALVPELASATVKPSRLDIWGQLGMGDPAPRAISLRTPGGCFPAPAVAVEAADRFDPASWVSLGAVASAPQAHDVAVLTSVAGLGAGERRAATLRLAAAGKTWDVPVNLSVGTLAAAGPLQTTWVMSGPALVPLADGRALLTGGGAGGTHVFDPSTRTWTSVKSPAEDRMFGRGVQLEDGRVLLCGGRTRAGIASTTACEVWSGGQWSSAGSLTRVIMGALLEMPRGRVLAVGGVDPGTSTPEILELATGRATPLTGISGTSAVRRPDGSILLAGESDKTWLYVPERDAWTASGDMAFLVSSPRLVALPDGRVMAMGEEVSPSTIDRRTMQFWDPRTGVWSASAPSGALHGGWVAPLSSGKVLVVGGASMDLEVFDPVTGVWSIAGALPIAKCGELVVTTLSTGMVLFVHGDTLTAGCTSETFTW